MSIEELGRNREMTPIDVKDWRLWKVCEVREAAKAVLYYEDYKQYPCGWPACKCERKDPKARTSMESNHE